PQPLASAVAVSNQEGWRLAGVLRSGNCTRCGRQTAVTRPESSTAVQASEAQTPSSGVETGSAASHAPPGTCREAQIAWSPRTGSGLRCRSAKSAYAVPSARTATAEVNGKSFGSGLRKTSVAGAQTPVAPDRLDATTAWRTGLGPPMTTGAKSVHVATASPAALPAIRSRRSAVRALPSSTGALQPAPGARLLAWIDWWVPGDTPSMSIGSVRDHTATTPPAASTLTRGDTRLWPNCSIAGGPSTVSTGPQLPPAGRKRANSGGPSPLNAWPGPHQATTASPRAFSLRAGASTRAPGPRSKGADQTPEAASRSRTLTPVSGDRWSATVRFPAASVPAAGCE